MLKLTKTGIGLLTKQYKSVLRKCLLLNLWLFFTINTVLPNNSFARYYWDWNEQRFNIVAQNSHYNENGLWITDADNEKVVARIWNYESGRGGSLELSSLNDPNSTLLTAYLFKLNNSGYATGIDFASNVTSGTTDASHLASTGAVNQLLNYYYTFRVDESEEVTDSASFFQKYFLTLQKVDLQSKNPTHLGAFTKCDEVCPRPSERFVSSLSQEQMFKNDASVDAGTSRHCLRQFGDVVADLLKNTAAKSLRISEFMNEEVCHA